MLRIFLIALVAVSVTGCASRLGNDLKHDFAVYVDRADLPNSSCQVDIGLNNNLNTDYANFEYALNFFDSQGRWSAGPTVQGDYIPSGGMSKRDFIFPVDCSRLASAKVARELCLDIVGWPGKRDCYDIDAIVINETVAMQTPTPPPPPSRDDVQAAAAPATPAEPAGDLPDTKPRFYSIYFEWNRDDLDATAQRVIDAIATDWGGAPEAVSLIGHADRSGSDNYNQELSERRVRAVSDALQAKGFTTARLTGVGRGESDPVVPTPDGVRERQNRRVIVTIEVR